MMFHENIQNNEYNAWNNKGEDLTDRLSQAIADVELLPHQSEDKLILIVQSFVDSFGKIAGFDTQILEENDIDFPCYDGKSDKLWDILRIKYNVNTTRKLHIYTYGTRFWFDTIAGCQRTFDSAILRGSLASVQKEQEKLSYKSLLKLRGTSLKVQEEVRGAQLFRPFMEQIVSSIEASNLNTIAITCRAGHHRSVSCAEMLIHLYPNRTVEHLTIDAGN